MIFGDFSTFMIHFSHFLVWWRFEGAAKTARNDQKCSFFLKTAGKHTHIARITHQNGPSHPGVVLGFFDFFGKNEKNAKKNYLEKGGAHRRNPHFRYLDEARSYNMTSMVKPTIGNILRGSLPRFCYPDTRDDGVRRRKSTFSFFFFLLQHTPKFLSAKHGLQNRPLRDHKSKSRWFHAKYYIQEL